MNLLRLFILLLCIGLISCNELKYVPKGDTLYVGSKVIITDRGKREKKTLRSELKALSRPKPNSKILGYRYKLALYDIAGTPKRKKGGLRRYIREKLGEPPVLGSQLNLEKNRLILQSRLYNRGYFNAAGTADTSVKKRRSTAIYTFTAGDQYKIRDIFYPTDTSILGDSIRKRGKYSILKKGNPFDLDVIKAERDRIDARLKTKGFYYFSSDDLLINGDTGIGDHKVDLYITIKKTTPLQARQVYRINDVYVFADYSADDSVTSDIRNAVDYKDYDIIDPYHKFKPSLFQRNLVFEPGDIYNRTDHNLSLNRLVTLGTFKFVKARFAPNDSVCCNYLDVYYYLTPMPKKSLRAQITGLTRSDNSTGEQLSINFRNRNIFKGAELFTATIFGGIDQQVSGLYPNSLTTRYGAQLSLYIPRIVAPFEFATNSGFVPKTRFDLGYEFFNRSTEYQLNSYHAATTYTWKENIKSEHQLSIISINYVIPSKITPAYQALLDTNIILARAIERQTILGSIYNYNYNTQLQPNKKFNNYYFNGNVDVSGNLLGLITGADFKHPPNAEIFKIPFSQYVRGEAEFRYYRRLNSFNPLTVLANRLLIGAGYTYGDNITLPFIKAFFSGGTNSIRAFRARSLGPGTYYGGSSTEAKNGFLPDEPGDIKIEANSELRFPIFSIVRGALFTDAGNIWLIHDDPQRPGGKFTSAFLNQLAVGSGVGIRIDASFLVLRIDLAMPLRKPYLPGGPAWVFNQVDFGSSSWRRDNLILNLAIGYPF